MTPAAILKRVLASVDSTAIGPLSLRLLIPREQIVRAGKGARGQATRAEYHLKLCAYFGVDPVMGEATGTPGRIVRFDAALFAMAFKMCRFRQTDGVVDAAKAMKVSASVVSRMQNGDIRSFEVMLAACRYGNLIPNNYVIDDVSRVSVTGKSLIENQQNQSAA